MELVWVKEKFHFICYNLDIQWRFKKKCSANIWIWEFIAQIKDVAGDINSVIVGLYMAHDSG